MTIWPRTPYQEKKTVRILISTMLWEMRVSWEELMETSQREPKVVEARERACMIAFEYLIPWMSEVKIAEWMGFRRSTFVSCRKRWKLANARE